MLKVNLLLPEGLRAILRSKSTSTFLLVILFLTSTTSAPGQTSPAGAPAPGPDMALPVVPDSNPVQVQPPLVERPPLPPPPDGSLPPPLGGGVPKPPLAWRAKSYPSPGTYDQPANTPTDKRRPIGNQASFQPEPAGQLKLTLQQSFPAAVDETLMAVVSACRTAGLLITYTNSDSGTVLADLDTTSDGGRQSRPNITFTITRLSGQGSNLCATAQQSSAKVRAAVEDVLLKVEAILSARGSL